MAVRDSILPTLLGIALTLLGTALLIVLVINTGQGIRGVATTAIGVLGRHRHIEIGGTEARSTGTATVDANLPSPERTPPHSSRIETRSVIHLLDASRLADQRRLLIHLAAHVAADSQATSEVGDAVEEDAADHGGTIVEIADESANRTTGIDLTSGTIDHESAIETGATGTVTASTEAAGLHHKDAAALLRDAISETREMCRLGSMPNGLEEDQETAHSRLVRQIRTPLLDPRPSAAAFPVEGEGEDGATGSGEGVAEEISTMITETDMGRVCEAALRKGGGDETRMTAIAGIFDTTRHETFEMTANQETGGSVISYHGSWIGYLMSPLLQPKMSRRRLLRHQHRHLDQYLPANLHQPIFSH